VKPWPNSGHSPMRPVSANLGWPQGGTPPKWFQPCSFDKIKSSSGLAGTGESGVGRPARWPKWRYAGCHEDRTPSRLSDSSVFLAMYWARGGPFALSKLIFVYDWVNRDVLSCVEYRKALNRLIAAGLVHHDRGLYELVGLTFTKGTTTLASYGWISFSTAARMPCVSCLSRCKSQPGSR
jgi:hypothetical protein